MLFCKVSGQKSDKEQTFPINNGQKQNYDSTKGDNSVSYIPASHMYTQRDQKERLDIMSL